MLLRQLSLKVAGTADGVVYGETILANAFWETLLANSKNVVNIGGNIETTQLGAEPEGITIGGLECKLKQASRRNSLSFLLPAAMMRSSA